MGKLNKGDIEIIDNSVYEFMKNHSLVLENGLDYLIKYKKLPINSFDVIDKKHTKTGKDFYISSELLVYCKYNEENKNYTLCGMLGSGYVLYMVKINKSLNFKAGNLLLNNIGNNVKDVILSSNVIAYELHRSHNLDTDIIEAMQIESVEIASDNDKREYYYHFDISPPPEIIEKVPDKKTTKTYFITDGEYIKIGITEDIEKRMSGIQTGNPKKISLVHFIEGNSEYSLHEKFNKYRAVGEWFIYSKEIKRYIEKLKKSFPDTRSGNLERDNGLFEAMNAA